MQLFAGSRDVPFDLPVGLSNDPRPGFHKSQRRAGAKRHHQHIHNRRYNTMKKSRICQFLSATAFTLLALFNTGAALIQTPSDDASLTVPQAQAQLQASLKMAFYKKEIRVTDDGFEIYYPHDLFGAPVWWDGKTFSYHFKTLAGSSVVSHGLRRIYQVKGINAYWRQEKAARSFADALDVLARNLNQLTPTSEVNPVTPVQALPPPDRIAFVKPSGPAASVSGPDVQAIQPPLEQPAAMLVSNNLKDVALTASPSSPTPTANTSAPDAAGQTKDSDKTVPDLRQPASSANAATAPAQIANTNAVTVTTNTISAFQQAVNDYQQNGQSWTDGERVAQQSALMDTLPPIPEEARKHFIMGEAIAKKAASTNDFLQAAQEFHQANTNAPWLGRAWLDMGVCREAAGQYDYALHCVKIYQMFKLSNDDARDAQDKLYQIQAEKDLAVKHAADEQAKAQEEARAKEQAQTQAFIGKWCFVNNDNGCLTISSSISASVTGGFDFNFNSDWNFPVYTDQTHTLQSFQILGTIVSFTTTWDGVVHYPNGGGSYKFHCSRDYNLTISDDGKSLVGKNHSIFTASGAPQDMTWDVKLIHRDD
jgi:hypothetical protein